MEDEQNQRGFRAKQRAVLDLTPAYADGPCGTPVGVLTLAGETTVECVMLSLRDLRCLAVRALSVLARHGEVKAEQVLAAHFSGSSGASNNDIDWKLGEGRVCDDSEPDPDVPADAHVIDPPDLGLELRVRFPDPTLPIWHRPILGGLRRGRTVVVLYREVYPSAAILKAKDRIKLCALPGGAPLDFELVDLWTTAVPGKEIMLGRLAFKTMSVDELRSAVGDKTFLAA